MSDDKNRPQGPENYEPYVLEAKELGFGWKIAQMWWLIPKKSILKRFELRADKTMSFTMWNGTQHEIAPGSYKVSWSKDKNDIRTIAVKPTAGKKIHVREMLPMLPAHEEDYEKLIAVLGAKQTGLSKFMNVASDLV